MKLKLIFSPFGWTVPSWKINRISRCLRWILVPLHNAIPRTWKSEILWPVELKCWATGHPGVLLRILRRCSLKRQLSFFRFHQCKEVVIGGRICSRQYISCACFNHFYDVFALRSTVQRFLFFSHWRRMINTKRLCFLENFWHFLIFFLYQVSPYQLKYKCHAFLTVFRLTFNSWSSDGFSQPKTTPSKKFFTSSPPNRARPKIPSLFPFCPNPTGKRIRRTRIHNQWLLLDFMYNLHTIVQSEWFVKRHLFVSKKDPECWLILFAQLYRIFFIDFRKYDPVSNFRLNRFLVAGLYCMWITTVSCNDKLFSVWNKLF